MSDSPRRLEREKVLELLYEAEMKAAPVADIVDAQTLPPEPFVIETATGVADHRSALDDAINRHAIGWSTDRMAALDHLVLCIGAYELTHSDVPPAVAINEAVELAKRFSTEESGKFVNGILSALADEVRAAG